MSSDHHITWHRGEVTREERAKAYGHKGLTVWLTGLSGSGKSTVASRTERLLVQNHIAAYVLDGDNVRHGLSHGLGFSPEDRSENIRRIAEVTKLFVDAGVIVLATFVSPYRIDRARVRALHQPGEFIEVYMATSLETCEARDPKGLYKKAREGTISDFTGISAPYEVPEHPELTLHTEKQDIDACAQVLVTHLQKNHYIPVLKA